MKTMLRAGCIAIVISLAGGLTTSATVLATEVQRVVSPLGIEAWLVESHEVPVIAVEFAFRGGIELDPRGQEGLANFASTLLDEGAGDLDSATFQRRLTDSAISLRFNAGTDTFRGSLKTVTDNSDEAFELLQLALTEPRFDDQPVERMRAGVLADIRRRVADPNWMAIRTYFELAFPDHPYGRPSRGTVATVQGLTADDLRGFVERRFTRDALIIGVAGDISADDLAATLDRVFGPLPASAEQPELAVAAPGDFAGQRVLVERNGAQSIMMLAQPGIPRNDPDFYAAMVVNHVLGGGGLGSRLNHEVRESRGLTYGISSSLWNHQLADLMFVWTQLSNENVAEALAVTLGEWRDVADKGISADELRDAQTYLTGSFPLRLTSTDGIAKTLVSMQIHDLGIDHIDQRAANIDAVTLEDANRVAAQLLDPDGLTAVVVGAPGETYAAGTVRSADEIAARELAPRDLTEGGG